MFDELLFPEAALELLRQARWDPAAQCTYEIMSGGFKWSDEWPENVGFICVEHGSWAFRYVLGYRASLIQGVPRQELRSAWEQLKLSCPEWPGFRPDRSSPALKPALDDAANEAVLDMDDLDRRINERRRP